MLEEKFFELPKGVKYIIDTLSKSNYQGFIVGGCVRDILLEIEPKDWDVTTDALPDEIKSIFKKTIDTGLKHGTVTVLTHNQAIEVTTFRIEGKYSDHRRPDSVVFTPDLHQDLGRRDFTINSIAYHPEYGIIDPFKGVNDIKNGIIRAVRDGNKRFEEDALRMLRALRFSAQLGFIIESKTLKGIRNKKHLICEISKERIRMELEHIIVSENPSKFLLLKETGLLSFIIPEIDKYPLKELEYLTKCIEVATTDDKVLRWAILFHRVDKKSLSNILRGLKFDGTTIKKVTILIEYINIDINIEPKDVKKLVSVIGDELFLKVIEMKDILLGIKIKELTEKLKNLKEDLKDLKDQEDVEELEAIKDIKGTECIKDMEWGEGSLKIKRDYELKKKNNNKIKYIYKNAKKNKECMDLKNLAISGKDLLSIGFTEGKQIGMMLKLLLEIVMENPSFNNMEKLIAIAKQKITDIPLF